MSDTPIWFLAVQAASYMAGACAAVAATLKYNLDRDAVRRLHAQENERKAEELIIRNNENAIADREYKWKQMHIAQEILDEMHEDIKYCDAVRMLDWASRTFNINGQNIEITRQLVLAALDTEKYEFTDIEVWVRDRFDTFFYCLERTQYQIDIGLTCEEYMAFPLHYYACRINENKDVFERYLKKYTYHGTIALIENLLKLDRQCPEPLQFLR